MLKFSACLVGYFVLFLVFEYINAKQMTSGSWKGIVGFGLQPAALAFFALSPILVWGFNKELYEFIGNRFWYAGVLMTAIEISAYIIGAYLFWRQLPTVREAVALLLVAIAIIVAAIPAAQD